MKKTLQVVRNQFRSSEQKKVMKKTRGKTDLVTKLNATVMANDMYNNILPAAMASVTKKRGRPKKKSNRPFK
jgi:hypothetical protein